MATDTAAIEVSPETIDNFADIITKWTIGTYFPKFLKPPGRDSVKYDPLITAIDHAAEAIDNIHEWIKHIRDVGPHDIKNCHICLKRFGLAHRAAFFLDARITEGFAYQFVPCKRDGCNNWTRPIGTREYCSRACRQAAYKARKKAV